MVIYNYTNLTYFSNVCPHVRKIIDSLKLVDYLHVPAANPWYNYYLSISLLGISLIF